MMKKIILIMFISVMILSGIVCLVSCDNKEPVVMRDGEMDQVIIKTLSQFLDRKHSSGVNVGGKTVEERIDSVKNNKQALHVAVDPKNYYFVAVYHDPVHEHTDGYSCCRPYNYTWVKFFDKEDITEYYGDLTFVAAFQINRAKFVKNIINKKSDTIEIEHYSTYLPEFKSGVNVADALYRDETYICFGSGNFSETYYLTSTEEYYHKVNKWPCTKYKGKYYIKQEMQIGYQNPINLKPKFGKYYDDLMEIMITDKYTEEIDGKTYYYGLFDIKEFSKKILK